MEIVSAPKTQRLHEVDFEFLGGTKVAVTLYPDRGDTFEDGDLRGDAPGCFVVTYRDGQGTVIEVGTLYKQSLLWKSERTRVVAIVDPKNDPVKQHVEELDRRAQHHESALGKRSA